MITFPSQRPYENIKLFLRRHWFVLFLIYLEFSFLTVLGPILIYLISNFNLDLISYKFSTLIPFGLSLYLLIIWQILFKSLTDFYLDTWLVTDHRILDIHQRGLFKRDVSELQISKVQDVSTKMQGLFPTFLNYGDVIVQTASEIPEFKFEQVPNPQLVKDEILRLYDQFIKQHPDGREIHEL